MDGRSSSSQSSARTKLARARSSRRRSGSSLSTIRTKSACFTDRCVITSGNHGVRRPKASCADSRIRGTPSADDVPGGVGRTFGTANRNRSAANARSSAASSRSAIAIRSHGAVGLIFSRTADSDCRYTAMPRPPRDIRHRSHQANGALRVLHSEAITPPAMIAKVTHSETIDGILPMMPSMAVFTPMNTSTRARANFR